MNIHIEHHDGFKLATLAGAFEGSDARTMADELQPLVASGGARLAVSLSELEQINSAGLSELINVVTRARLSGSHVVLIAPSAFVKQVFDLTRLDRWFDIVDDVDQASAALHR